jgi:hypothetical protein
MKRLIYALAVLFVVLAAAPARAQVATVLFDAATGTTVATANSWTSVLYVNGTAFPMVHTCAIVGTVTTCSAPLPNITAALTPLGTQTFEMTFKDAILGESLRSAPFVRVRPAAPSNLRIQ